MTPQAAVGTGLGGLAAAGVGGTAVAYAAGAFGEKEIKKDEEVKNYLFQALAASSNAGKEYIGENKDSRIKTLLADSTSPKYSETLKNVWDKMNDDTSENSLGKPNTDKDELFKETIEEANKESISTYTSKWCEHISKKPLSEVPTTGVNQNTWDAFNKACFWTKVA
ncbi:hypothetical protein [Candidatus Mycoplasma haematohominis]|uniref:Uncharacterized protein n=1 Tax=Candidatus Mycoplasma haematohominis TaxID=1494318 RepID=A0A478FPD2_9MOLU|nr:hypothetical protein [Candidatus Mycoplasma haemohominis]GCE63062.1 hypothetical protein MHSWG343_00400 [Candidatus Mycoplasma haemohominis]